VFVKYLVIGIDVREMPMVFVHLQFKPPPLKRGGVTNREDVGKN